MYNILYNCLFFYTKEFSQYSSLSNLIVLRRQAKARGTVVSVIAVPVALACARIVLEIVIVPPGGVRGLATAGTPVGNQIQPRRCLTADPVSVEIAGCAGVIRPHVGILYAVQRTTLPIIFCGKLTARGENSNKTCAIKSVLTKL
jgi:hypothetical protein